MWSRVSTVELPSNVEDMRLTVRPWTTGRREPGSLGAFDVGVLDVADDGTFVDSTQMENVLASILDARAHAPVDGQPVVVVFVHGWHHNSEWRRSATIRPGEDDGDPHFAAFREALRRLVLREEERPSAVDAPSRRVIGVYVGWRGDWRWFGTSRRLRTFLSFWGRYRTARGIGRSPHLVDAVGQIIEAVKAPLPASSDVPDAQVGQLVVIGHSMGALIVEETLHALVAGAGRSTTGQHLASDRPLFPDLMLALNSAADSRILTGIVARMNALCMEKQKSGGAVSYSR